MAITVTCLFDRQEQAERCVGILLGCGFTTRDITIIASKRKNGTEYMGGDDSIESSKYQQLISETRIPFNVFSVSTKGIGTIQIMGAMTNLFRGVAKTSSEEVYAALLTSGLTTVDAEYSMEGLRRGGTLLLIRTAPSLRERLEDILKIHHGVDQQLRMTSWQRRGWNHFDPQAGAWSPEDRERERRTLASERKHTRLFHPYEGEFRSHFYISEADQWGTYEELAVAYYHGYRLAGDPRFQEKSWSESEREIRQEWETSEDTSWSIVEALVSYGFTKWHEHYQPKTTRRQRQSYGCSRSGSSWD